MEFLLTVGMGVILLIGFILYAKNLYRLATAKFRGNEILVILRAIGVFIPMLGVLLGFIDNNVN